MSFCEENGEIQANEVKRKIKTANSIDVRIKNFKGTLYSQRNDTKFQKNKEKYEEFCNLDGKSP